MTLQSADPRHVTAAEAVAHRWAWPGLERLTIDGQEVNAQTVIVEVLRAADGIGLLRDSAEPLQESAVDVEAAARLLANYSERYEDPPYGRGWQAVLQTPEHAYTAAMTAARSPKTRDQIDIAYGVVGREVRRRSGHSRA